MKKVLSISILFMILFTSCGAERKESSKENIELSSETKALILKDYTEATQILSLKYDIPEDKSQLITAEYIRIFDPVRYELISGIKDNRLVDKIMNPDENISNFIERMALLTEQSKAKVASYVMDMKLYLETMNNRAE